MNKKNVLIGAAFALMTTCAWSQEQETAKQLQEVVVSDSKFPLEKEKSGKVITKITAEDLKNYPGQNLSNILSTATGIEINGNQSVEGKNLGYYIRGGKSNQVLILIDGVPATDASAIGFEFDLRFLSIEQIESIEIMKGAASTLYGSGAATGVINIVLKKATEKPIEAKAFMNLGTNNTSFTKKTSAQESNQGFSVNGTVKKVSYLASINSTETSGMSQIASADGSEGETDRFSRLNYASKLAFKASEQLSFNFYSNFDKINNAYDDLFNNTGTNDSKFNYYKSEQFRLGFAPKFRYKNGAFDINSVYSKTTREYEEFYNNAIDLSNYAAKSVVVDAFNKYTFSSSLFLVTGIQYQFHNMSLQSSYSQIDKEAAKFIMADPYSSLVLNLSNGFNINAGARFNHHSQYGNQGVFHLNPSYDFKEIPLKIISSISTAFITPSLYQLYSEYGNTSLTPEKNRTIETGFELQLLNKKIRLNSVGFYRDQTNFIGFGPAYRYINIDGTNTAKGIETECSVVLNNRISWSGNYTFTEVVEALDRLIPKHKANMNLNVQLYSRLFWNTSYQYVNGRKDTFYDENTSQNNSIQLGSYQLINTSFRLKCLGGRLLIFAAATNLFNIEFVENIGYNTRGRNYRIGLAINL